MGGFGFYSMNLLSPVVPQLSIWPGRENFILRAMPAQNEGFDYLGLGILGLLALTLLLAWRPLIALLRAHVLLCITLLGLSVYAVSTRVYVGSQLVLSLPTLEQFGPFASFSCIFRSSGRFFWPFGYFLTAVACYALYARAGTRRFTMLISLAIAVQAIEMRPLFASVQERAAADWRPIDRAKWVQALRSHDGLIVLPQFLCTTPLNQGLLYGLGLVAARLAIPTNSANLNRSSPNCEAETLTFNRDLRSKFHSRDPLVLLLGDELTPEIARSVATASGLECVGVSIGYACSTKALRPSVLTLGSPLGSEEMITLGAPMPTFAGAHGLRFLGGGWSEPSPWGIWGTGPEALILARLAQPACGDLILDAAIMPLFQGTYIVREATVTVNGRPAPTVRLTKPGEQWISLPLPNPGCTEHLEITLRFDGLRSPMDLGMNSDTRLLSWA